MMRRAGFTFAETLAAMAFAAIVIPVAIAAISLANRGGVMAERKRLASDLAQRRLAEIVVEGAWQTEAKSGDFGQAWRGYRWQFTNEAWSEDTLRLLTVEVRFTVQEREYGVRLATLVEETPTTTATPATQETQTP